MLKSTVSPVLFFLLTVGACYLISFHKYYPDLTIIRNSFTSEESQGVRKKSGVLQCTAAARLRRKCTSYHRQLCKKHILQTIVFFLLDYSKDTRAMLHILLQDRLACFVRARRDREYDGMLSMPRGITSMFNLE